MPHIFFKTSLFHHCFVPDDCGRWINQRSANAGGHVSANQHAVVLVATFYSGMPPQQIEADITDTFERFFTLGSGIDHMESRSMAGVA